MERKAISKKMKFDVLKRDNFTCQYCGKQAPKVVLELDHINPVVNGGKNTMLNLITSCFDCNRGKGKRLLSDNSKMEKEMGQLNFLSEKNEQIKLINKWKKELDKNNEKIIEIIYDEILKITDLDLSPIETFKIKILKEVEKIGLKRYLELLNDTLGYYFIKGNIESCCVAQNKILKFYRYQEEQKNKPYLNEIYFCRNILNKNFGNLSNQNKVILLKALLDLYENFKYSIQDLKDLSNDFNEFYEFMSWYNK
ncbi:MAG: HNH endonuclease [Fusobacteriaceae bacterium]